MICIKEGNRKIFYSVQILFIQINIDYYSCEAINGNLSGSMYPFGAGEESEEFLEKAERKTGKTNAEAAL